MRTEIRNGRVVTPETTLDPGRVVLEDGRIERIDERTRSRRSAADTIVDADGRVVLPGLIDLHGDDIERHVHPRSNADVDRRTALIAAARSNLVHGITTKFHAIAFEETPEDNRTLEGARNLARTVDRLSDTPIDDRVHARCELDPESIAAVADTIEDVEVDLVSIMHHGPECGQFPDAEGFTNLYVNERDCTEAEARELVERRRRVSPETIERRATYVTELATEAGIPVASHDDETANRVECMADHGVAISEYPVSMAAARRAQDLGLEAAMGAPNLVRGGSLWGNLAVADAIEADAVDVLCSDYHPPSLLAAPFVDTGEPLHRRVARVTSNPADAVGLDDRGRLRAGARGDVIVVDPDPVPTVTRAFVAGFETFRAPATAVDAEPVPLRRG